MANLHRFRDLPEQNARQPLRPQQPDGRYPILGYGFELGSAEECRKESFGKMLTLIFCPHFRLRSFIFFISVVQIVIFFTTVFYDYDTDEFLEPKESTLVDFGAKEPSRMQQDGEVWRFITPVLLHATITHLFFNMIMQLILGFRLEPTVGLWKTIGVYVGSAIGGVVFSCLVSPDTTAVGASTAIFGLIGSMIAWLVMNWTALYGDPYRTVTLVWLIFILIISLFLGFMSDLIDNWGHFGGMITGFLLGWLLFDYIDPPTSSDKTWKISMGAILAVFYVGGLALFFTVIETD